MRNLKKILALALALVMAMSLMTVANAAADFDDYDEINYKEAVDVMTAVGVIDGMDGTNFAPDGTLTREQAAKLVTYMLVGQSQADRLMTTIAPYTDVAAGRWSAGAIAYCTNAGIISGNGDGTFDPTGELTGLAFAKVLLVALGYNAETEKLIGDSWAINAATLAASTGLLDGLDDITLSAPLTREQAAQMAFNAMKTPLVEYDSKTTVDVNGSTITIGGGKAEYVTTDIAKTQTISDTKLTNTNVYTIEFAEKYCPDLVLEDETNALEQPVNEWTYKNETIGTYAVEADAVAVVADKDKTIMDVLTGSSYMDYSSRDIAVDYQVSSVPHYNAYVNGQQKDASNWGSTGLTKGDVVYAYEDSNGDVEKVVVASYTYAKIDSVATNMSATEEDNGAAYRVKLVDIDGNAAGTYYDVYDNDAKVLNGFDADTYEEDVVLAIAVNADGTKEIVDSYVAEIDSGKPNAVKEGANGSITVNSNKYDFAGTPAGVSANFDFDNEYEVYATKEGYAIAISGVTNADVDDLYYVTGVYSKNSTYGETNLIYFAQRVSLADGSMDTVQVEKGALQVIGNNATVSTNSDITNSAAKAWAGLYTFNDKKVEAKSVSGGTSDEQKSGNEIYTMVPFASDTAVTDDFGATNSGKIDAGNIKVTGGVKVDATKIDVDGARSYYVNADTKYLAVESLGSDIDVAYAQGGMKVTTDPVDVIVVYDADDARTAVAVIYVAASGLNTSVSTQDVVYLASQPTVRNSNDTWDATLYYMEDNSEQDVVLDDNYGQGFYVYSESNGVLKLENADKLTLTAAYDDEAGPVENLVINEVYKTTLFSTTANHFDDIRFNSVTIIDNRSQSDIDNSLYPTEITTIADLKDAVEAGGTVMADIYFDDGATFIAVDSVNTLPKLDNGMDASDVKDLPDGTYVPTDDDFAPGDVAGEPENNVIVKFTVGDTATSSVSLSIKDSTGAEKMPGGSAKTFGVTWAANTEHFIYFNVYGGEGGGTDDPDLSAGGTYTVTVKDETNNEVLYTGTITVEPNP